MLTVWVKAPVLGMKKQNILRPPYIKSTCWNHSENFVSIQMSDCRENERFSFCRLPWSGLSLHYIRLSSFNDFKATWKDSTIAPHLLEAQNSVNFIMFSPFFMQKNSTGTYVRNNQRFRKRSICRKFLIIPFPRVVHRMAIFGTVGIFW